MLISFLIFIVIVAAVVWIIELLPLPAPWSRVFQALIILFALLWFLSRTNLADGLM